MQNDTRKYLNLIYRLLEGKARELTKKFYVSFCFPITTEAKRIYGFINILSQKGYY